MKALVIFSGGIDSTICLAKAINECGKKNVIALSFNYGQKNYKELVKAEEITKEYNIKLIKMDISNLFINSNSAMLRHSSVDIPKKTFEEQFKELKRNEDVSTSVPFRNGLMLSIAASIAISMNAKVIYYGIHKESKLTSIYPDCSREFIDNINKSILIGTNKKVKVVTPLIDMSKSEVVKEGIRLNIPFEKTWTCYENADKPCMKCTACMERIEAFESNVVIDPLIKGDDNNEKMSKRR
jgi:7-cyano-7-deazaguanine synthase